MFTTHQNKGDNYNKQNKPEFEEVVDGVPVV
jgi:hypothetical protein